MSAAAPLERPSMRAVALSYAERGWPVFPLWPRSKFPITENGSHDATTDRAKIESWWRRWPNANVAIATGASANLLIVDIDGELGETTLRELQEVNGALPQVPGVATRRGRHLYFAFDSRVKNSAGRIVRNGPILASSVAGIYYADAIPGGTWTLASGSGSDFSAIVRDGVKVPIDTRSTGGYVLAPPSVHPDGGEYAWTADAHELAPVAAPEWLLQLFMSKAPSPASDKGTIAPLENELSAPQGEMEARRRAWGRNAVEREASDLARVTEGGRGAALNQSAYKLGGYVSAGVVDRGQIEAALVYASTENGLVRKDGIDSVRSGCRRGMEAGIRTPRPIPVFETRPSTRRQNPAPLPSEAADEFPPFDDDDGFGGGPPPDDEDFGGGGGGPGAEGLPVIFDSFDEDLMAKQADEYLALDPELYQRGGLLTHVLTDRSPAAGIARGHQRPRIAVIEEAWLRALSTRRIVWKKKVVVTTKDDKKQVEERRIKPPRHAIAAIKARAHWEHIRPLEGVTTTPLFRHDGTVLDVPGYDRITGVLFEPFEKHLAVKKEPTRRDVDDAIEDIRFVVSDFPFEESSHEAAFFAALITPLARPAFRGPSPLFLIDANAPGTGKGLLAKVIGIIATGAAPTMIVQSHDDAEERKRITSVAIDGDQLVQVDNVEGRWGSPTMCAALTTDEWSDRVLGGSSTYKGPLLATWIVTGNNVQLTTDMVRRTAHIRMLTREERPEERIAFQIPDLEAHVREHRPKLVRAALTILRGWHVAGRPTKKLSSWGSFEGWSGIVRQALVWAGLRDPGETRGMLREVSDTQTDSLLELIDGMVTVLHPGSRLTAGELVVKARSESGAVLREALEGTANRGVLSAKSVGRLLLKVRGRVTDGRYVAGAKDAHRKQWVWWVARADGTEVTTEVEDAF